MSILPSRVRRRRKEKSKEEIEKEETAKVENQEEEEDGNDVDGEEMYWKNTRDSDSDSDDDEVTNEFKAFVREMHVNGALLPILTESKDGKKNIHMQLKSRGVSGTLLSIVKTLC